MKDELSGKVMTHYIGLKPKSYCYKVYGEDEEHKRSKGILKHKVANELNYNKCEETLHGDLKDKVEFNTIRSKSHQIYSINQVKYSLSNDDHKRYWLDNCSSLPFGHYSINQ